MPERTPLAARPDSEAGFRFVFENGPIGQVFTGMDGIIVAANDALATMLGRSVEEIVGRHATEFISGSDYAKVHRDEAELRAQAQHAIGPVSVDTVHRYVHRDGHEITARVISTLLSDPDGTPRWWLSMLIDLTETERSRRELERVHAAALDSAARLQLLYSVSAAANDAATLGDLAGPVLRYVRSCFGWRGAALVRWTDQEAGPPICLLVDGAASITALLAGLTPPVGNPNEGIHVVTVENSAPRLVVVPLTNDAAGNRQAFVFAAADPRGAALEAVRTVADVCSRVATRATAIGRLHQSEQRFRTVFDASPLPMALILGESGTVYEINQALCHLVGRSRADLLGKPVTELIHPDDARFTDGAGAAARISLRGSHRIEARLVHVSGAIIATMITLTWTVDSEGIPLLLAQLEDITARRAAESVRRNAEAALRQQAQLDGLTGLVNRSGLARELAEVGAGGHGCVVIFLDLDGFKWINDTRGSDVADNILVQLAARLQHAAGSEDLVARAGGDAFVVVHPCQHDAPDDELPHRLAERVHTAFAAPLHTQRGAVEVTASIGCAATALSGAEPGMQMLQHAEAAMYQAKRLGKDRIVIYDAAMHYASMRHQRSALALRDALTENRFVVHYQPVVDLRSGDVVAFEALVRLLDEDGNLVMPDTFIASAEQSGLIVPMGEWVLRESCRTIARLRRESGRALRVGVNIAAQQAARSDLTRTVDSALAAAQLPSEALALELTESALLDAQEYTLEQLRSLHARGLGIVIDDFGTGYSSLTYLRRFPISHVKVDRSFVRGLGSDAGDTAIVRAVITLATDLGLQWVAEGVETEAQRQVLARFGPGLGQGELFGKPVPVEALPVDTW